MTPRAAISSLYKALNQKLIEQGGESHIKEQFHQRNLKWLPKLGDRELGAKLEREFFLVSTWSSFRGRE
jgi:hypothetical protein